MGSQNTTHPAHTKTRQDQSIAWPSVPKTPSFDKGYDAKRRRIRRRLQIQNNRKNYIVGCVGVAVFFAPPIIRTRAI